MLSLHAAKLLLSRLWKKASYTNPPPFIINGSTAHTARIVLTFLHDAFKNRVISYRITQGQICRRCFSVVNESDYSRRTWPKNKVFANWSQSILNLTAEKICRNCATPLVMALAAQLLLIVATLCTTFFNVNKSAF
jgi:ribosomal protein L40E